MSDCVVTVPQRLWAAWLAEGDLPGQPAEYESHFFIPRPLPRVERGARVYIVAWGRLRGYAPLVRVEARCQLRPASACLVRADGAVACTLPTPIRGFQGWRYVWWDRADEVPCTDWMTAGVPSAAQARRVSAGAAGDVAGMES